MQKIFNNKVYLTVLIFKLKDFFVCLFDCLAKLCNGIRIKPFSLRTKAVCFYQQELII
jgi:hypothetical protein